VTIVVTGGSGLVGSHVIAALVARGVAVRAIARPGSRAAVERLGATAVTGDVTDATTWRAALHAPGGVRGVVHAAALVAQRAALDDYLAVNVTGTVAAARAARTAGGRLVHLSSVSVYGRATTYAAGRGTIDESFPFLPLRPSDYYARSKRLAEERLWEECERGGLWAVALRPNVIYGERDRLFSPRVARVVRWGVVPQIGPGGNVLSIVYAGNVAAAVLAALDADAPGGRAYNVTNDGALTQREFVDAFAAALDTRVRRLRVARAPAAVAVGVVMALARLARPGRYGGVAHGAVHFLAGDNPYRSDRARAELGWRPPVEPRTAIERTVRWLRQDETPGQ
jgi:nucleoside-diphosphate-sugar epimerase